MSRDEAIKLLASLQSILAGMREAAGGGPDCKAYVLLWRETMALEEKLFRHPY